MLLFWMPILFALRRVLFCSKISNVVNCVLYIIVCGNYASPFLFSRKSTEFRRFQIRSHISIICQRNSTSSPLANLRKGWENVRYEYILSGLVKHWKDSFCYDAGISQLSSAYSAEVVLDSEKQPKRDLDHKFGNKFRPLLDLKPGSLSESTSVVDEVQIDVNSKSGCTDGCPSENGDNLLTKSDDVFSNFNDSDEASLLERLKYIFKDEKVYSLSSWLEVVPRRTQLPKQTGRCISTGADIYSSTYMLSLAGIFGRLAEQASYFSWGLSASLNNDNEYTVCKRHTKSRNNLIPQFSDELSYIRSPWQRLLLLKLGLLYYQSTRKKFLRQMHLTNTQKNCLIENSKICDDQNQNPFSLINVPFNHIYLDFKSFPQELISEATSLLQRTNMTPMNQLAFVNSFGSVACNQNDAPLEHIFDASIKKQKERLEKLRSKKNARMVEGMLQEQFMRITLSMNEWIILLPLLQHRFPFEAFDIMLLPKERGAFFTSIQTSVGEKSVSTIYKACNDEISGHNNVNADMNNLNAAEYAACFTHKVIAAVNHQWKKTSRGVNFSKRWDNGSRLDSPPFRPPLLELFVFLTLKGHFMRKAISNLKGKSHENMSKIDGTMLVASHLDVSENLDKPNTEGKAEWQRNWLRNLCMQMKNDLILECEYYLLEKQLSNIKTGVSYGTSENRKTSHKHACIDAMGLIFDWLHFKQHTEKINTSADMDNNDTTKSIEPPYSMFVNENYLKPHRKFKNKLISGSSIRRKLIQNVDDVEHSLGFLDFLNAVVKPKTSPFVGDLGLINHKL